MSKDSEKIELIYFGGFVGEDNINTIASITKTPFNVAQSKLDFEVIKGLLDNKVNTTVYCMPFVSYDKLDRKTYTKGKIVDDTVGNIFLVPKIRIPIVKYIVYFIHSFLKILFIKNRKNKIVFISVNYLPVTLGIIFASYFRRVKTICMLTDCARNTYNIKINNKKSKIKKRIIRIYQKVVEYFEKKFYAYIFLTEEMNRIINKKNKPYRIMEGIYSKVQTVPNQKKNILTQRKVILYAGSLFEIYGIKKITEVSEEMVGDNVEFHFYGGGELVNYLKCLSIKQDNIKYKGFVNQEVLAKEMSNADLLVNLRDSRIEYTKLSFPSKMFDYMASGTPVLTTKLDGIPIEYYDYVFSIDSYSSSSIADKIREILKMDEKILMSKVEKAKKFVENNKNSSEQSKIIMGLIHEIMK